MGGENLSSLRHLFNMQYFHGFMSSAKLCVRGWALILNFAPSNPHTVKKGGAVGMVIFRYFILVISA